MATVYFPSNPDGEVIYVEFISPAAEARSLCLLVDSGFTGVSDIILSQADRDLVWGTLRRVEAFGALQGDQERAHVVGRIPGLVFEQRLTAIVTDLSQLILPHGVEGMAGLTFLRRFSRWGAERTTDGRWQFFLSESEPDA